MTDPSRLPDDPALAELARALADTRWGATIYDRDWRLVWVSEDIDELLGTDDPDELGYGRHLIEVFDLGTWREATIPEGAPQMLRATIPYILHDTPGGAAALDEILDPEVPRELFEGVEPAEPPPLWSFHLDYVQPGAPVTHVHGIAVRLRDEAGALLGITVVFGSGLPIGLLNLLARGDPRAFERVARLADPGRRRAGILFADLRASGALSRHLPSSGYFGLIQALTTRADALVLDRRGIVGKHAGDGVTAFFLADDAGSPSAAARATIEVGVEIPGAVEAAVARVAAAGTPIDPSEIRISIGLHWGDTVYMGQLVGGGRLEVTALGDEVNECARIEQSAGGGEILASKALVERLRKEDAAALGIDPGRVLYRTVGEIPGAPEKAVRDAGTIPVTRLEAAATAVESRP